MDTLTIKRYSAAFKQSIVREYEVGASMTELLNRYGIGSSRTMHWWMERTILFVDYNRNAVGFWLLHHGCACGTVSIIETD